jgi:AraC-like DNA-binding protein
MILRTHIPGPPLADFVELMWFNEGYAAPHALERVMPTGDMSIIINLYEDRTRVYDPEDARKCQTLNGALLVGASSNFGVIDTEEQRSTFGVVFRPGGAFPFFRLAAGELQNAEAPLDTFWGRDAELLREQLLATRTPEQKFAIGERALLRRIMKPLERHAAVRFAVDNFKRRPGQAVAAVMDQIGLSERRFIQVFADQVGLTPKLFCRVQRFQRVLRHITGRARRSGEDRRDIDWTQIALGCGYFDQPHFNHDFRAFSGISPSTYVANRTGFQNHVVLAD